MSRTEILPALAKGSRDTLLALVPVIGAIAVVLGYLYFASPSNGQELVYVEPELCEGPVPACETMDYIPDTADSAMVIVCFDELTIEGLGDICTEPMPQSEADQFADEHQDLNPRLSFNTIERIIELEWRSTPPDLNVLIPVEITWL